MDVIISSFSKIYHSTSLLTYEFNAGMRNVVERAGESVVNLGRQTEFTVLMNVSVIHLGPTRPLILVFC